MNRLLLVAEFDGHRHEIVQDDVGYYLFRYMEQGPQTTHDFLQDSLEMARFCAESEFDVPKEAWRQASVDEVPACNR